VSGVTLFGWIGMNICFGTELHPIKALVSGVITINGAVSLVVYPAGKTIDAKEWVDTLQSQHIPAIRESMGDEEWTLIQVTTQHTLNYFTGCFVC
jgi:hypothetical protein